MFPFAFHVHVLPCVIVVYSFLTIIYLTLQTNPQGADGLTQPGPIPARKHTTSDDPRPTHAAPPISLQLDNPRVWFSGHCSVPHSCTKLPYGDVENYGP